jgi:hypothetical protein
MKESPVEFNLSRVSTGDEIKEILNLEVKP